MKFAPSLLLLALFLFSCHNSDDDDDGGIVVPPPTPCPQAEVRVKFSQLPGFNGPNRPAPNQAVEIEVVDQNGDLIPDATVQLMDPIAQISEEANSFVFVPEPGEWQVIGVLQPAGCFTDPVTIQVPEAKLEPRFSKVFLEQAQDQFQWWEVFATTTGDPVFEGVAGGPFGEKVNRLEFRVFIANSFRSDLGDVLPVKASFSLNTGNSGVTAFLPFPDFAMGQQYLVGLRDEEKLFASVATFVILSKSGDLGLNPGSNPSRFYYKQGETIFLEPAFEGSGFWLNDLKASIQKPDGLVTEIPYLSSTRVVSFTDTSEVGTYLVWCSGTFLSSTNQKKKVTSKTIPLYVR